MTKPKTLITVLAASALLALAGCSSGSEPAANSSSSPSVTSTKTASPTRTAFPFKPGAVSWEDFSKEASTANQAIKTLHVKTVSTITTAINNKSLTTTIEGDVDQTNPNLPSFHITTTNESNLKTEVIVLEGVTYVKSAGKEEWVKYPVSSNFPVSPPVTSTSLFKRLADAPGAVKEVKYVGKDETGHRFTLSIDMTKLVGQNAEVSKVTDVVSDIWLNDDLQLVKQVIDVKTNEGTSTVTSEQSNFNKPVALKVPANVVPLETSTAPQPSAPNTNPAPPVEPPATN